MPRWSMRMSKGQGDELVSFCFNKGISPLSKILHLWLPAVFNSWFRKYHSGHGPFPQPSCEYFFQQQIMISSSRSPGSQFRFWLWLRRWVQDFWHGIGLTCSQSSIQDIPQQILAMAPPESFKISACKCVLSPIPPQQVFMHVWIYFQWLVEAELSSPARSTLQNRSQIIFAFMDFIFP